MPSPCKKRLQEAFKSQSWAVATKHKGRGKWTKEQGTLNEHQPVVAQDFFCGVPSHLKEAAVSKRMTLRGCVSPEQLSLASILDSPIACIYQRTVRQSRICHYEGVPQSCQNLGELSSRSREPRDLCVNQLSGHQNQNAPRRKPCGTPSDLDGVKSSVSHTVDTASKSSLMTSSCVAFADKAPHPQAEQHPHSTSADTTWSCDTLKRYRCRSPLKASQIHRDRLYCHRRRCGFTKPIYVSVCRFDKIPS